MRFHVTAISCCAHHFIRGSVRVNDVAVEQGDGAAISDEPRVAVSADGEAEFLLVDLD